MLLNCGVGEDFWESLGQQGYNQSILKEISPEYSLELCWSWNASSLATWHKELTHWKRPWCWERLKAGGEGDDRRWVGWMASPTQWTWVSVNSRRWWWTGRSVHGVAKSQTQLIDWIELNGSYRICFMWFGSSSSLISYFPLRRFTLVLVIHNTLTNQP